jgi:hypothetical protein
MADYQQIGTKNPDGAYFGVSATDKIAFYGSTPIIQRSGATQGTFTTTTTQSTGWGFLTSTAADAAIALLTEIRATLVALGLMKGSA